MQQYAVRSGQNIYDVALTLYGSVEGVFDLLLSNSDLTLETKLEYGMVLNYHTEFVINQNIVSWLKNNNIIVKNGEHVFDYPSAETFAKEHIEESHPDIYASLSDLSPDEQNMYWESLSTPMLTVLQTGSTSNFTVSLRSGTHIFVDWGDYSDFQIVEGDGEIVVEHCYKGSGNHQITFFGDFECYLLDLTEISGVYYPLGTIYADTFKSKLDNEDLKKLIIT